MSRNFEVIEKRLKAGVVCGVSVASPSKETGNEDNFLIEELSSSGLLLAVSDGMGGHKGGAFASKTAIEYIKPLRKLKNESEYVGALVHSVESAHRKIKKKGIGAGATLTGVLIYKNLVRFFSIGDSKGIHFGGRGTIKYETIEHSPIGFAVKSGLIEEAQELFSEESHLISNVLGHGEIRIEVSQSMKVLKKDTVLLASDGLLANLSTEEIIHFFRKGILKENMKSLTNAAHKKMESESGHPDDLTIVAFQRSVE